MWLANPAPLEYLSAQIGQGTFGVGSFWCDIGCFACCWFALLVSVEIVGAVSFESEIFLDEGIRVGSGSRFVDCEVEV